MNEATLKLIITASSKAAEAALTRTRKAVKGISKNLKAFGRQATAASKKFAIGIGAAGVAIGAFAAKSVSAFNMQARAEKQLETLVLNVKGATDQHVQALKEQASALQDVGVVGDEVTMMGQAQLATFGLQQQSISNLTPALLDMVTQIKGVNATQEDMQTIGNLVGKVMSGQVGALSRYGVTLSDAQAEQLKMGTEMERSAVLAKVLDQNFGGVNEALRETFQGKMQAAKNTIGDLMEQIGGLIAKALTPAVDKFNEWANSMGGVDGIVQSVKDSIQKIKPFLPQLAIVVATMLVPAFVAWAAAVLAATWPLVALAAIGLGLSVLLKKLADSVGGWSALWDKLKDSLKKVWDIIGPILLPALSSMWDAIKDLGVELQKLWKTVAPVLIPALKVMGVIIGGLILARIWSFINVLKIVIRIIGIVARVIGNLVIWLRNAAGWFGSVQRTVRDAMSSMWNWVKNKGNQMIAWFRRLPGNIGRAIGGIKNTMLSPFKSVFNAIARVWNDTVGSISFNVPDWVPGIGGKGWSIPKIPTFAKGVRNFAGGMAIVGEQGPELAHFPRGTNIFSNRETRQAFDGNVGAVGGQQTTKIHNGNVILNTPAAVREYFSLNADDNELVQAGLTPRRGLV